MRLYFQKGFFIMAQIDLSKNHSKAEFKSFKGIDRASPVHSGGLEYISNFRIGHDGSLTKRCGFEERVRLPFEIRAVHRRSDRSLMALAGSKVYSIDISNNTYSELAEVSSTTGDASFFTFGQALYLTDSDGIYVIEESGAMAIEGYAPLYGKDWDPRYMGDTNEKLNILSDHLRISYKIGASSPSYFYLPFQMASVDAVFLNGEKRAAGSASLTSDASKIQSTLSLHEGDTVLFFLSMKTPPSDRSAIMRCKKASVAGSTPTITAVLFYDGDDSASLFLARAASPEAVNSCLDIYPCTSSLYTTLDDRFSVDGGQGEVTAVCSINDRFMIFTEERAFFLVTDGNSSLSLIATGVGCLSKRGVSFIGGEPVTVSRGGIFKWKTSSRADGDFSCECISVKVGDLLPYSFCKGTTLFTSICTDELFVGDPSDPSGNVLVYSIGADAWYSFSGIAAEHFFECSGSVGFIRSSCIYFFDQNATCDTADGKSANIRARIESSLILCDPINDKKRLSNVFMLTSKGASVKLTVTDAEGRDQALYLSDNSSERLGYIESRIESVRSRYYSFSIEDSTPKSSSLYSVVLSAAE